MDSTVSRVRSFFRFRFAQMRGMNFTGLGASLVVGAWALKFRPWEIPSCDRCVAKLAFVQVNRPAGPGRGVRVVGDHNDGLAVLAVERLQQVQYLVARLAVKIARGL